MFKIGVISDTHGLLDPKVTSFFATAHVEHILHAGDVGTLLVIRGLEQIAPVTAVTGNTDSALLLNCRKTEVVELAGLIFLVHHIVDVHSPAPELQSRITRANPDAVIFGHSHKPFCDKVNGRLFFNPGYAGKSRFNLPRSVAILSCKGKKITSEYRFLDDSGGNP
jgi:putative phosphoesterase